MSFFNLFYPFSLSFFFFLAELHSLCFQDLSSLTKYGTRVRSNESAKSQPLDHEGTPSLTFIMRVLRVRTFHGEIRCHDAFDRTGLYELKGIISCSSLGPSSSPSKPTVYCPASSLSSLLHGPLTLTHSNTSKKRINNHSHFSFASEHPSSRYFPFTPTNTDSVCGTCSIMAWSRSLCRVKLCPLSNPSQGPLGERQTQASPTSRLPGTSGFFPSFSFAASIGSSQGHISRFLKDLPEQ